MSSKTNNKTEYTPGQKAAIELRDGNILVSASAGAGKTAVLTERIVNIVLDESRPVDIDRIVVVTFTRAAAAEMRSRIAGKLSERLQETPGNYHIQKQLALLSHAQITTIDSFCMGIVRNYYYTINLDPAFRVGDNQEMDLMMNEVLDELMEKEYETGDEAFINMVETFAPGKSDRKVTELITELYKKSKSHPWPQDWLESCKAVYDIGSPDAITKADWYIRSGIKEHTQSVIHCAVNYLSKASDILNETLMLPGEDDKAYAAINKIIDFISEEKLRLQALTDIEDYETLGEHLYTFKYDTFPRAKLTGKFLENKEKAKNLRTAAKDAVQGLIRNSYYQSPRAMAEDIRACAPAMKELIRVVNRFSGEFAARKEENNVVAINDIEHFALRILLNKNKETGEIEYTAAANELMELYEYILIDEYQDSNDVQETILSTISRERIGKPNMFMVGDVKQSIYQFRLAKPDIFESKFAAYADYTEADNGVNKSAGRRILLKRNFRSTDTILKTVNYIFEKIMNKNIGNVNFDESHAFDIIRRVNGEKDEHDEPVEVIYVTADDELNDYSKRQIEGLVIADKIRKLTGEGGMKLKDRETGVMRPVKYSDITILLRSMQGWSEELVELLTEQGIPAIAEERKGFFAAKEIQIILSMLKIIDNPRQDIPLTAVLRSVYGGMSDNELAMIRTCSGGDMYQALTEALHKAESGLADKCSRFIKKLNAYRHKAAYMSVYELIISLYKQDSYMEHMKAMPAGARREGNLMMLAEKALAYEDTDSKGLMSFLRYIDLMKKADIDFGEAVAVDSNDGVVHIMSIHKSKGLEFPVVIVAGMGKKVNLSDSKESVPIQPEIGPAPDYFDWHTRVKRKTLLKSAVNSKIINDTVGEELRILYVAFTRARNKLIMTGYINKAGEALEGYAGRESSYLEMLSGNSCYYDWISPCFAGHPLWYNKEFDEELWQENDKSYPRMTFCLRRAADIVIKGEADAVKRDERRASLMEKAQEGVIDEELNRIIEENDAYAYPYMNQTRYAVKMSVSDIKHNRAVEEEGDGIRASWSSTENLEYIPSFIREDKDTAVSGADRGTMYHNLMEHLDIECINSISDIENRIRQLCSQGILDKEAANPNMISAEKIYRFCQSDVARRMAEAEKKGCISREQPFVMGVGSDRIYPDGTADEIIIVQGIIDVYFEEEDGIVLLDYKTDRLAEGEEQKLVNRYRAQMQCYKEAIEKAKGKAVKEIILYSFSLGKEIRVNTDE